MQWRITAMLLGVLLVLGSVNATPWGLQITSPVENYWFNQYYRMPVNQPLNIAWSDNLMHQFFTINLYSEGYTLAHWEDGKFIIDETAPEINQTWRIDGKLRKLLVPANAIKLLRDDLYDLTVCNDYNQCDSIRLWKEWND